MRCCVPNCRNDSRNISKTDGITYHVFPTDPVQRQAWLKGLGRLNWEPKERATVCSQHFFAEDLYETQGGMRKVRAGAVPLVVPPVVPQGVPLAVPPAAEPVSEKVCRMCLAMDVELLSMKKCKLEAYYELITGVSLSDTRLPTRICALCARRAAAGARLRDQCVRADAILTALLTSEQRLTEQNIKSIDREANNLTSPLTVHIVPDHEYLLITETAKDLKIKENKMDEPPSLHEVNVAEDIEVKNEDDDNTFFDDEPNLDDNMEPAKINDTDHIESNYEENDNFIPWDNSSCDSIPINQLKKAKLKKKKEEKKPAKKVAKVRKKAVKKDPTEPKIDRRRKPFLNEDLNETLFTIIDLTYEEQIAEIEKRQESSNYKNAVYKCTECYKGFLDEDAYETHMVRHTDACGEYTCKICKTHFKQPHALRKHITAHHTHRFSCNCCVYVTTHRQTARLHERWHKGTKYQCPHCPEEFVRFTTYMGHVRIKHPSDFVCARCGYSFVSAKGIELHKKLKHRLEDQPIPADGPLCSLCNIRFATEDARQRHMQVSLRHAADKEPKEANAPKGQRKPRDGKSQRKERDARREEPDKKYPSQMRKAEGPIPCEQCGMQLEDSRAYHGHFRRAHPDKNRTNYPSMKSPCMCEVCGRMFQSFALLKDHTWTHTGEKPFKCELCNKTFRMKQRLVAHRRVHSAQRASYTCAVCHKHFSTHSNRQRHMFIHTGLKPFKCEMCGKCFKHASEKRAHVSYVHLKKPWPKRARAKRQHAAPNELDDEMRDAPAEAPLWPPCDPKLNDMAQIIHDKPMYYNNIKI